MTEGDRVTELDRRNTEMPTDETITKDRTWILVPLLAFGSVLVGSLFSFPLTGTAGCILASIFLAYLAYRKPKKDIVSLLTPLYAVLIFFNDSFNVTLLQPIQILYAASITLLVFRLNARFSRKDEVRRKFSEEEEEESA
jgi:hypothetical protein